MSFSDSDSVSCITRNMDAAADAAHYIERDRLDRLAQASPTLGVEPGPQSVTVRVTGLADVVFSATGT